VRSFPGRPGQVSHARAFVADFLRGCPTADEAVLLVSEMAANACAHSASGRPGGSFIVRAQVSDGGRVYAEVEDEGSAWDGSFGMAESPHGLYLLRALSTECGTHRGDRGWISWFVLDQ
jgi:two-component sensor histidine kinase